MKNYIIIINLVVFFTLIHGNPYKDSTIKFLKDNYAGMDTAIVFKAVDEAKKSYRDNFLQGYSEKTIDLVVWAEINAVTRGFDNGWSKGTKFADNIRDKSDSIFFSDAYSFGWKEGFNTGYLRGSDRASADYDILLLQSLINAIPRRQEIYLNIPQQYRIDFYYHPSPFSIFGR